MAVNPDDLNVVNNPEKKRFEIKIDGKLAMVEYIHAGSNIVFTHTEVPVEFEGMGIGAKMAKVALDFSRENNLKVQPLCPFIKSYIMRHEEYHDLAQW